MKYSDFRKKWSTKLRILGNLRISKNLDINISISPINLGDKSSMKDHNISNKTISIYNYVQMSAGSFALVNFLVSMEVVLLSKSLVAQVTLKGSRMIVSCFDMSI